MELIKCFNDIYSKPNNTPWSYDAPSKHFIQFIESNNSLGKKVLEIGCGEGIILYI